MNEMEKVTLRDMNAYARNIAQMVDDDTMGWTPERRHFLFVLVAEKVLGRLGDEFFFSDEFENC